MSAHCRYASEHERMQASIGGARASLQAPREDSRERPQVLLRPILRISFLFLIGSFGLLAVLPGASRGRGQYVPFTRFCAVIASCACLHYFRALPKQLQILPQRCRQSFSDLPFKCCRFCGAGAFANRTLVVSSSRFLAQLVSRLLVEIVHLRAG